MIKALALTGPTASGKTALSLSLARELGCEIISLDSMQIYKGMDIGTAKATAAEQAMAPHHMLSVAEPNESYSTERYRDEAMAVARDICGRGRIPLFVGGTGLYLDTLTRARSEEAPASDPAYAAGLLAGLDPETAPAVLWERLMRVDPESAEKIHMNNVRRVIRALEVYDSTGIPKSELDRKSALAPSELSCRVLTLDYIDRELMRSRIALRVDLMMKEGLLEEVESLWRGGLLPDGSTAAQAIGYKEIISYFKGETTLAEAVERIKISSGQYAKRQITWFRHVQGAVRILVDDGMGKMRDEADILAEALEASRDFFEANK